MDTLIIADNLTGAANTGVKFTNQGPVKLTTLGGPSLTESPGILALNTETRHKQAAEVATIFNQIKPFLGTWKPQLIYKKIDSCLRGYVGLEILTLLNLFDFRCALVAPAYPELGRWTFKGVHLVNGKPVHLTENVKTTNRPFMDSRLKVILHLDNDLPIEEIDIDQVRAGPEAVNAVIAQAMSKHDRFILSCDAETDDDLSTLARGSFPYAQNILYTGSAGLAASLMEVFSTTHNWLQDEYHPPVPNPPSAFFSGSAASVMREQLRIMAEGLRAEIITIKLRSLFEGPGQTIPPPFPAFPLIVTLPPPSTDPDEARRYQSSDIIVRFGQLAADLIINRQYKTVFIAGGETANETLLSLGLNEINLRSELCPGVVYLSAGPLSIISKSGDFGEPDLLINLFRELQGDAPLSGRDLPLA
jgi:uncharacterized protein YgbK (DUF1537 family)